MNPMALHEIYPGACGTKQYSEDHVKITAFTQNVLDLHELNNLCTGQKDRKVSSTFKFLLPFAVQQSFTNLENFEGKECVKVLDKHSGLKVLLLNLEMVSVLVSYDPQCFQTISVHTAVQPPQQMQQETQGQKKRKVDTISSMQQSYVRNMPFITPNAKTSVGLAGQVECGETGTQENSASTIFCINSKSGGYKLRKPANQEIDDIDQSEEDTHL